MTEEQKTYDSDSGRSAAMKIFGVATLIVGLFVLLFITSIKLPFAENSLNSSGIAHADAPGAPGGSPGDAGGGGGADAGGCGGGGCAP